jgi:hypothetical protein
MDKVVVFSGSCDSHRFPDQVGRSQKDLTDISITENEAALGKA